MGDGAGNFDGSILSRENLHTHTREKGINEDDRTQMTVTDFPTRTRGKRGLGEFSLSFTRTPGARVCLLEGVCISQTDSPHARAGKESRRFLNF